MVVYPWALVNMVCLWDKHANVTVLKGSVNLCLLVNIKCHMSAITRDLQSL